MSLSALGVLRRVLMYVLRRTHHVLDSLKWTIGPNMPPPGGLSWSVERRYRWALRLAVLHLGTVSIVVAGMSLTIGQFGGLFWLVPTILIYMLWSLNNAWLLVVQASEEEL